MAKSQILISIEEVGDKFQAVMSVPDGTQHRSEVVATVNEAAIEAEKMLQIVKKTLGHLVSEIHWGGLKNG